VGIHSFGGLGGGNRVCRDCLIPTGRGSVGLFFSVGLFLGLQTVELISATFSSIGAILTELQPFSCFWAWNLALSHGILVSNRDDSGLLLD